MFSYDSVAQLDRAFGYEPKGRVFESLRGHQLRFAVEQSFHGFLFCFKAVSEKWPVISTIVEAPISANS
jgi:hypothetical protein